MLSILSPATPSWLRLARLRDSWCLAMIMWVTVRVRGSEPWSVTWRSSLTPWSSTAGRRWSRTPGSRSSSSVTPWGVSSLSWPPSPLRCRNCQVCYVKFVAVSCDMNNSRHGVAGTTDQAWSRDSLPLPAIYGQGHQPGAPQIGDRRSGHQYGHQWSGKIWTFRHLINNNAKVERRKLKGDKLRYHGGLKALMGNTMLDGMSSLEQKFSNVKSPYLLILGSEDKLSYIDGSKVGSNVKDNNFL